MTNANGFTQPMLGISLGERLDEAKNRLDEILDCFGMNEIEEKEVSYERR